MPAAVKMYSTRWCPYSRAADALLREKGIAYEFVDVTGDPQTRAWLLSVTGQATVPQIFIDGRSIGGYRELYKLERSGELDTRLAG